MSPVLDFDYLLFDSFFLVKDDISTVEHFSQFYIVQYSFISVVGDPISEEDRVVHLLASLPDWYGMLVTVLEAHEQVPEMVSFPYPRKPATNASFSLSELSVSSSASLAFSVRPGFLPSWFEDPSRG